MDSKNSKVKISIRLFRANWKDIGG